MKKYKNINIILIIISLLLMTVIFLFAYEGINVTTKNKVIDNVIIYSSLILLGSFITNVFKNITQVSLNKKLHWYQGRLKLWNSISYKVKVAGEKSFNEMPLAIIVYNDKYKIEWANNYAKEVFMSSLVERDIHNLNSELASKMSASNDFDIDLYERKLHVSIMKDDMIMFLTDKTELMNLELKYQGRMQAAGIINLDNLEEALASMDAQEHNMVVSKIMGILGKWCENYNLYIRGFSEKQYIILMDRYQLDNLLTDNFKVIDEVKAYCYEKNLRITVSIGISCFDAPIIDVMDKASEQLELALNRGGNQAVVYIDGNTKFFGGKDASTETRTPVYVRVKAEDLVDMVKKSDKVYIMTHGDSDADAFGSTLAMNQLVRTLGKPVRIICEESQLDKTVKKVYKMVEENHINIIEYFIKPNDAINKMTDDTLLIITDCQGENLVSHPKVLKAAKHIAIIDHHRRGENAINNYDYLYNKPSSSSTVELIVEMYEFLEDEVIMEPIEASLMLLGIVIDTAHFIYRTSYQTFNVMARLQLFGADMSDVKKLLRDDFDEYSKKNNVTRTVEVYHEHFAISVCPEEEIVARQFLAKVSDELISLNNMIASFCVGRLDDHTVGISARSLGDVNVQVVMEQLNGGGHFNNAATQIQNVTIEEAKAKLIEVLKNFELSGEEETMEIILIKDVKGKGKPGDIINVATGYANHLIRDKKAILKTDDNVKELKRKNELENQKALAELEEMKKLKVFLDENPITIYARVGKEGQLFGQISSKQIVDEFKAKFDITLDKRKFVSTPINALGTYTIEVLLHKEVKGKITVHVVEKKA